VLPQIAAQTTRLYFGRLFAWSKIAGGSMLSLMLVFHAPWLTSFGRPELELMALVSFATGYGLLRQQMWGLYLLTAAFVLPLVHLLMVGEGRTPGRLLPMGFLWNLIGLWYFWEHRRDLEA